MIKIMTLDFRLLKNIYCLGIVLLSPSVLMAGMVHDNADINELLELDMKQLLDIGVTSASRENESAVDAPAKVVVITAQDIRNRGYINLFDLLKGEAGIDAHEYSHETTYTRLAVRGVVGNNKFIIQKNGINIGSPDGSPVAIADNFPLFNAQRVEIVYGPGSALYGADAFSGIINIVTKRFSEEKQLGTYLGEDGYRYLYGDAGFRLSDDVEFYFSAHIQQSDNPDLSKTYPDVFVFDDLQDFNNNVIIPAASRQGYYGETRSHTLSFDLSVGSDFILSYHQYLFMSPTSTGLQPDAVNYDSRANWESLTGVISAVFDSDVSESSNVRTLFSHSFYKVDSSSKFNNLFSHYIDGYKYAEASKTTFDAQLSTDWGDADRLLMGVVLESIASIPKMADLDRPYNDSQASEEQVFYYAGTDNSLPIKIYNTSYTNMGAYLQHRHQWGSALDSILGVRYDNNSRYGETVNPRLGMIYRPDDQWTVKLLYGEAFLAPAPEFTFEHFGAFTGVKNGQDEYISNFFFVPNTDLMPEEIQTLEMNFTFLFTRDLMFDMSLYHSKVESLILNANTQVPQSGFIEGGFIQSTSHNDNVGDLDVNGLELGFSLLNQYENYSLKSWGSYSYTEGSLNDNLRGLEVDLPFVSKNKIKLGLTYRDKDRFYVTPLLYWIDEASTDVPDLSLSTTQSSSVRSYTLLDLNIGQEDLLPGLSLSLKIKNLLDRQYYNAGTGVNITFAESPQNPRQFIFNLDYKF